MDPKAAREASTPSMASQPPPAVINWDLPNARHGPLARFVGPGATRAELVLQFSAALVAAILLPTAAALAGWGWNFLQLAVAGVLALDLVGGIVTNATNAAKRWYHRPGQSRRDHARFLLIHLHPFLVVWLFGANEWVFAFTCYAYVVAAGVVTLFVPLYLRRPVAMVAFLIALTIALYGPDSPANTEWFFPMFALKLLVSHVVREEPYRPNTEKSAKP